MEAILITLIKLELQVHNMSDVVGIEKITDRAGTGAPDFTNGFNINGSDSGLTGFAHTEGAQSLVAHPMETLGGIVIITSIKST